MDKPRPRANTWQIAGVWIAAMAPCSPPPGRPSIYGCCSDLEALRAAKSCRATLRQRWTNPKI